MSAAVYEREQLAPGQVLLGPALVGQLDCTTWLAPGTRAVVERDGALLVDLGAGAGAGR